jgi:hypothetical protein
LAINGSWWLGTAAGALLTIVLLNPGLIPEYVGWRLCFGLGAVLGIGTCSSGGSSRAPAGSDPSTGGGG